MRWRRSPANMNALCYFSREFWCNKSVSRIPLMCKCACLHEKSPVQTEARYAQIRAIHFDSYVLLNQNAVFINLRWKQSATAAASASRAWFSFSLIKTKAIASEDMRLLLLLWWWNEFFEPGIAIAWQAQALHTISIIPEQKTHTQQMTWCNSIVSIPFEA